MTDKPTGIAKGLTNYGDPDFSIYLRRSFASSMGYSREMLSKKIVGIAYTPSGFNNCHRHFPELLEALKVLDARATDAGNALSKMGRGATLLGMAQRKARDLIARAEGGE